MKFLVSFLLTGLLSFICCLYLPWWSVAIVAIIVNACINQKPLLAFLSGFAAIFLLWVMIASGISSANNHILAHRISQVILTTDSPTSLIGVTGLIGGLVAGFAALAGSFAWKPK